MTTYFSLSISLLLFFFLKRMMMDLAGCKIVTGVLPCWLHIRNRNYDDSRLPTKTVEGRFSPL